MAVESKKYVFYKNKPSDDVWWVEPSDTLDEHLFSFDKQKVFNLFHDYPKKLSAKQKAVFDRENPEWKAFFEGKRKPASTG